MGFVMAVFNLMLGLLVAWQAVQHLRKKLKPTWYYLGWSTAGLIWTGIYVYVLSCELLGNFDVEHFGPGYIRPMITVTLALAYLGIIVADSDSKG